jgi:uncharacterized membrane protein YgcG
VTLKPCFCVARLGDVNPFVKRTLAGVALVGISVGVSLGAVVGLATPARADVQDFTFASFTADYWLSRDDDGSAMLRTVETFVAEFPNRDQNRGIIRALADEYNGLPLQTRVSSVVDGNGDEVPFEEDDEEDVVVLTIGEEYVRGQQTYVIEYTQRDVVRNFEDTGVDELYWDTNGTGFEQSFGEVRAAFHIDAELEDALTGEAACYFGNDGSSQQCDITRDTDAYGTVFSAAVSDVGPGENLTAAIGFTAGTFVIPDPPKPASWAVIVSIVLTVLVALATIAAVIARARAPRDADGRGTIIAEYSVPEQTSLFVAANVARRTDKAVPAAVVALAVRGNIQIVDDGDDDFSLRFRNDTGVDAQEAALLEALFGKNPGRGAIRSLKKPSTKLATALRKVVTSTDATVVKLGLRQKVTSPVNAALLWVLIALFALAIVLFILNLTLSPAPSVWGIVVLPAALVGLVVAAICAYLPPVLTQAGAEMRDYVKGVKVYLELAEADRFRLLQSPDGALRVDVDDQTQVVKLYEKLLPYAVLWGIEREWSEELAVRYETVSPSWYDGVGGYNPAIFAASMHSFSQSATTASSYSASTGASSTGGSAGGGSSGGGGGGGGGGGH